jgi:hypothetical protein
MPLPTRFGVKEVGDLVALADAAHVRAAGLAVGSTIRFFTAQDARVRGDTHDDIPMEPIMYGRLAIAMIRPVSRRPSAPNEDGDDNKPMWSVELASSWARLNTACGAHVLAESDSIITTASTMLPPKRPTVDFVAEASPVKKRIHISVSRWLGLSDTPFRALHRYLSKATGRHQRAFQIASLHQLRSHVSNRYWSAYRHIASRLSHGAFGL